MNMVDVEARLATIVAQLVALDGKVTLLVDGQQRTLTDHEQRIRELERVWWRTVGIATAVSAVMAWVASNLQSVGNLFKP